jgi:hypothetical protein
VEGGGQEQRIFSPSLPHSSLCRHQCPGTLLLAQVTKAKEKVEECLEQVERADGEVDSLTAKLDRRTRLFDEERKLYYKEFLMLREMVRRAGLLEENSALLKSFEGTGVVVRWWWAAGIGCRRSYRSWCRGSIARPLLTPVMYVHVCVCVCVRVCVCVCVCVASQARLRIWLPA